jgi:CPA1 family monovalent cation:H+ antiporter
MALALSLAPDFPARSQLLSMTFGVVAFSIVVQGLTMKPLLTRLGLEKSGEEQYDRLKVRRMAVSSARTELEAMRRTNMVSHAVHQQLLTELDEQDRNLRDQVAEFQQEHPGLASDELRSARHRLLVVEKSTVHRAAIDGMISAGAGEHLAASLDEHIEKLNSP